MTIGLGPGCAGEFQRLASALADGLQEICHGVPDYRDLRARCGREALGGQRTIGALVDHYATDVLAGEQVVVALVELLERVPLRNDLVELEVS